MIIDYHLHSRHSFDSDADPQQSIERAAKLGVSEICFTEHVDFEDTRNPLMDIGAYISDIKRLMPSYNGVRVKLGFEIGLDDVECSRRTWDFIKDAGADFIIGSVHMVDGVNAYYNDFFAGQSQAEAYGKYIDALCDKAKSCAYFSVLGHYDFVTKYAPYKNRALNYGDYAERIDRLLKILVESGKSLEINTSSWRDGPAWGIELFRRYRELGGEFVTLGADSHSPKRVGKRLNEALTMAMEAGIKYIATFDRLSPVMHRV